MTLIQLNLTSIIELNERQFLEICQSNQNYKFERTAAGILQIFRQPDRQTKQWTWAIASQFWTWNQQTGLGVIFDNTAFRLPNGSIRRPNLAWVKQENCSNLTAIQTQSIIPLCPDFILELLSPDDDWQSLQLKMQEYQNQGASLGWLIDPILKKLEIYAPGKSIQRIQLPDFLSGDDLLIGLGLDLKQIFFLGK